MKLSKLMDIGLYFVAGMVIFAVVAAMVSQMSEGATAEESAEHKKRMSEPVVMTASEAADTHLASARLLADKPVRTAVGACANGACDVAKAVKSKKPVRKAVRSYGKRVRQGIFGWRKR